MPTLLVANRGEIAARVLRTARSLGLRTVAVFSDGDAESPHVQAADVAVRIGPAPVGESYLDAGRILDAARRTGTTLIHPGYGFLSENADFAHAAAEAGLTWVGPPASAIAAMGDKAVAKMRMRAAGVPVVPGFEAENPSEEELVEAAGQVGFPLLVKATAGGGGRGMRRVDSAAELTAAIRSARSEAAGAFGSDRVLLERYVERARHIEIQVMADSHGNVIHLGERDCSAQRRHQKVVEEAPGPSISPAMRARMGQAACAAAAEVGYVGAGTVELLVDADDDESFFFLEMNTRLQVEHPVTELVTGLDLVELQLRVALGEPLPVSQDQVKLSGHAIEVRIYAEEPAAGFAPRTGRLVAWGVPEGEGIRVDSGVVSGSIVTPHYDPMLAKLIAFGPTREVARRRVLRALHDTVALGLPTNRRFLSRILAHEVFATGQTTTRFLDDSPGLQAEAALDADTVRIAAAVRSHGFGDWQDFRPGHPLDRTVVLDLSGSRHAVTVTDAGWSVDGESRGVRVRGSGEVLSVEIDGIVERVRIARVGAGFWLQRGAEEVFVQDWDPSPDPGAVRAGSGTIAVPSAGRVLEVRVQAGDPVRPRQVLLLVEAMKIETRILADLDGEVSEVLVEAGQTVKANQIVVRIAPAEEGSA